MRVGDGRCAEMSMVRLIGIDIGRDGDSNGICSASISEYES